VVDRIQLKIAGKTLIPRKMGSYRYLVFQQRPVSGVTPPLELQFSSFRFEQPVHGGRTDVTELCGKCFVDIELWFHLQHFHVRPYQDDQPLSTLVVKKLPELP
jgi:hypothetical protein